MGFPHPMAAEAAGQEAADKAGVYRDVCRCVSRRVRRLTPQRVPMADALRGWLWRLSGGEINGPEAVSFLMR